MELVVREMLVTVLNCCVFLGQPLKANEIKKSLVNIVLFVCPSQKRKKLPACFIFPIQNKHDH